MDKKENVENKVFLEQIKEYIQSYCPDVDLNIRFASEDNGIKPNKSSRIPAAIVLQWRNNPNENYRTKGNKKLKILLLEKNFPYGAILRGVLSTDFFIKEIQRLKDGSQNERFVEMKKAMNFNENYNYFHGVEQYIKYKNPLLVSVTYEGNLEDSPENIKVKFRVKTDDANVIERNNKSIIDESGVKLINERMKSLKDTLQKEYGDNIKIENVYDARQPELLANIIVPLTAIVAPAPPIPHDPLTDVQKAFAMQQEKFKTAGSGQAQSKDEPKSDAPKGPNR